MSRISAPSVSRAYLGEAEKLRSNDGQWAVYESSGNCIVLAGPGSGKTKTLTVKLAKMLAEDVHPSQAIACLTFNNETVRELRRRLDFLGVRDGRRVVISTVHSFCLHHVVSPFGAVAGLPLSNPLRVALKEEQEAAFAEAVTFVMGQDEKISAWRPRCDLYRRVHLDRGPTWREHDEDAARVIEVYEGSLADRGVIDFDGMILTALHLIRSHDWVRRALNARFPVLVVDEYQDLGHALHQIVLSLCFDGSSRLLAVGDPDQSIYGFTGADPGLLRELSERKEVSVVELSLNYRCGQKIIDASACALEGSRPHKAASANTGTVDFYLCRDGLKHQVQHACDSVILEALARKDGRTLGDIAILYKDRNDGQTVSEVVQQTGWDFIRVDQGSPYPHTPMTFLLQDCAAWCAGGWRVGEPRLSSILRAFQRWNSDITSDRARRLLWEPLVSFLCEWRDGDRLLSDWLEAFQSRLLGSMFSRLEVLRDEAAAVEVLTAAAAPNGALASFTIGTFGGQRGTSSHLNLMTLHSSKGLEFDVVVMVGLEQGRLPSYQASRQKAAGDAKGWQSDRRLFYVGLTRARHEIHLMRSGWYEAYGRRYQNGRSEFLQDVADGLGVDLSLIPAVPSTE
jgi:DNA helicase II / ATP-dependent DNA helicase PcrA